MHNLDRIELIEKIDQRRMRDVIGEFPEHVTQAFALGKDFSLPAHFADVKNIVFCGMGGSAIGAETLSFYLRKELELALYVNRDYTLPGFVDKDCLVILLSYSGNTEETLSAYKEARAKGAKIVVITSGGEAAALAEKEGHPCLLIPQGFPPRGALAFLCFPVLALFSRIGLIGDKEKDVTETISLLEKLKNESLGIDVRSEVNPAKKLALRLFDKFCVIYAAAEHLSAVVTRWRGQLAENSKALSSSHLLPEMNHNEIVGWQHPHKLLKSFVALILRDKEDHPQVKKRIEINKEILQKEGMMLEEVYSNGEGLLARTFSLIYTGDYVSFYLAILNKEDPTPVKRIDYLKKRLKEWK
ncbi:MAG: bifunctional phosphoglucose/phosphomannose isomerase [Candidatus Omnitrophota bacterium]|nr:MAG: bifunctional phosphoglucose/phosphomannose isomerase [Candidatus Omnitrophota bacterium]